MLLNLWQAAVGTPSVPNVEAAPFWPTLGVGGAIAVLVLYLWRFDRKESQDRYERLAKESQDRYERLAKESNERAAEIANEFRQIVQDNTRAITTLGEKISGMNSSSEALTVRMLLEAIKTGKILNLEP